MSRKSFFKDKITLVTVLKKEVSKNLSPDKLIPLKSWNIPVFPIVVLNTSDIRDVVTTHQDTDEQISFVITLMYTFKK